MHFYNPNKCWNKAFELAHSWIIYVPVLAFEKYIAETGKDCPLAHTAAATMVVG